MAKQRFKDYERYLLENWSNAVALEASMAEIRGRHRESYDLVLERVQSAHKELDHCGHQHWNGVDRIYLGKETWPALTPKWPSAFFLGGIGLDNLMSAGELPPFAMIYLGQPPGQNLDLEQATKELCAEVQRVLTAEENARLRINSKSTREAWVMYSLSDSAEYLRALALQDDSTAFVDCLASHLNSLTKFTDVLDGIFQGNTGRK